MTNQKGNFSLGVYLVFGECSTPFTQRHLAAVASYRGGCQLHYRCSDSHPFLVPTKAHLRWITQEPSTCFCF